MNYRCLIDIIITPRFLEGKYLLTYLSMSLTLTTYLGLTALHLFKLLNSTKRPLGVTEYSEIYPLSFPIAKIFCKN